MPFVPDKTAGRFVPDQEGPAAEAPKSLSGFAQNVAEDAISNVKGAADYFGHGGFLGNVVSPERALRFGQGLSQIPGQIVQEVKHPIESLYKKPISTALDMSTAGGIATDVLDGIRAASRSVALKTLPRSFAKTAGIPERATAEALANPELLKKIAPTENEIQQHAVGVIDALREAKQKIGEAHGQIYKKYAQMESPMEQILNSSPQSKSILSQRNIPGEANVQAIPGSLSGETTATPGKSQAVSFPADTAPMPKTPRSFEDVKADWKSAKDGSLFKVPDVGTGVGKEMSNIEKLQVLTNLKREASQYADFFKQTNPNSVAPIDSASSAAAKTIASQIDNLRSQLPNGQKLAAADKGWQTLNQIYNDLQRDLSTPGKAEDSLMKLYKRDMSAITAGRTAEKFSSIRRLESLSGKKVLQPVFDAFTSREFNKGIGKGLSHTLLEGGAAGTAMTGLLTGHPMASLAAIAAALTGSPKVLSLGLRAADSAGTAISAAKGAFNMPPLLAALLASKSKKASE